MPGNQLDRLWSASGFGPEALKYFALFNLNDREEEVEFIFEWDMLRGKYQIRDLGEHPDPGVFEEEFSVDLDSRGAGLYRMTPR